jgi:hypothetical protein
MRASMCDAGHRGSRKRGLTQSVGGRRSASRVLDASGKTDVSVSRCYVHRTCVVRVQDKQRVVKKRNAMIQQISDNRRLGC